jgi:hypothetical protein
MVRWLNDGLNGRGESVGLGLENGSAAMLDFIHPVNQTTEERAHRLTDSGLGTEADVGRHLNTV